MLCQAQCHYSNVAFILTDEEFLQAQGGVLANSLNSKLNTEDNENDENDQIQIIKHSPYFDNQKLPSLFKTKLNVLAYVALIYNV